MISAVQFNGIVGHLERVSGKKRLGMTVKQRIAGAARLDLVYLDVDFKMVCYGRNGSPKYF